MKNWLQEQEEQQQDQNKDDTQQIDEIEPQKPAGKTMEHEVTEAAKIVHRPTSELLMSGGLAGIKLGFSLLLTGTVLTLSTGDTPEITSEILGALGYAVGFIFIVMGRSELFTEHTSMGLMPVLHRRSTITQMLRLWGLVYVANLVGGLFIALLAALLGPALEIIEPAIFREIAMRAAEHPGWLLLLGSALAAWLLGLMAWLVSAARDTVSQVLIVLLAAGTIGLLHLQHIVTGSIEIMAAIFAGSGLTWAHLGHFILWVTPGNIIGGVLFALMIHIAHRGQQSGR